MHVCRPLAAMVLIILVTAGCGAPAEDGERSTAANAVAPSVTTATPSARAGPPTATDARAGVPERLLIPRIDVAAPVQPVGSTPEGAQEVPDSMHATGWWKHGPLPAAAGNTVIVGHTWSAGDGVFDRLGELRPGDRITVHGTRGATSFEVREVSEVPVEEFGEAAARIYRDGGPPALVLLTCGDFDGEEYDATVVVRARLAG